MEIKETICTDGRTFETHFIRLTRRSQPNNNVNMLMHTVLTKSQIVSTGQVFMLMICVTLGL